jgi:hypothetical protein
MSTQRREDRPTPATRNIRGVHRYISNPAAVNGPREFRSASRPSGRPERDGYTLISTVASDLVPAGGIAAPPVELALLYNGIMMPLGVPAAPSLQSDCCNKTTRWACSRGNLPWLVAPQGWTPRNRIAVSSSNGSSESICPALPARLHPSLPRVPAALSCRTERQDGKRDLYIQHAA